MNSQGVADSANQAIVIADSPLAGDIPDIGVTETRGNNCPDTDR
jgi:hypothetical protein